MGPQNSIALTRMTFGGPPTDENCTARCYLSGSTAESSSYYTPRSRLSVALNGVKLAVSVRRSSSAIQLTDLLTSGVYPEPDADMNLDGRPYAQPGVASDVSECGAPDLGERGPFGVL